MKQWEKDELEYEEVTRKHILRLRCEQAEENARRARRKAIEDRAERAQRRERARRDAEERKTKDAGVRGENRKASGEGSENGERASELSSIGKSPGWIEARGIVGRVISEFGKNGSESKGNAGSKKADAQLPTQKNAQARKDQATKVHNDGENDAHLPKQDDPQPPTQEDAQARKEQATQVHNDGENDAHLPNQDDPQLSTERVRAFVKAHSSIETCLYNLPEDDELCGLWGGLVVSFALLESLATRWANARGEDI